MTWDEFLKLAVEIVDISKDIGDNWELSGEENQYSQYLVKRVKHVAENQCIAGQNYKNDSEFYEDMSEANLEVPNVYTFEYHVTYSISYMVPVLSFNCFKSDGSMLILDEVWNILKLGDNVKDDKYAVFTQMDHPVLQRPFLTIHPCRTQQLLENFPMSENLLISFISAIGSYVGLDCNLLYGKKWPTKTTNKQDN